MVKRSGQYYLFLFTVALIVTALTFLHTSNSAEAQSLKKRSSKAQDPLVEMLSPQGTAHMPKLDRISTDYIARYLISNAEDSTEEDLEEEPLSNIEQFYTHRIDEDIRLYGKSFSFAQPDNASDYQRSQWLDSLLGNQPVGRVQDDFILGVGDRLRVTFRGQRDDSDIYTITAQGQIIIEGFNPMTAAGLSIGELRHILEKQVQQSLINTMAFVSLEEIRQVNVMVLGEVKKPGQYQLSAFHSVFDALEKAHGLLPHASLRHIKLVRSQTPLVVDLYDLLLEGTSTADLLLKDGDRIHISPIGESIAVAGDVKNPAIFELPASDEPISAAQALSWAGSTMTPFSNRYVLYRLNENGQDTIIEIFKEGLDTTPMQPGDIIEVASVKHKRTGGVTLSGHTGEEGFHALALNPDVKTLFQSASILGKDIYPYFAVIERIQNQSLAKSYVGFSPQAVLNGKANKKLSDQDHIYLFAYDDIEDLLDENHSSQSKTKSKHQDDPLFDSLYGEKRKAYKNEKDAFYAELSKTLQFEDDQIIYPEALKIFVKAHVINIRGAVQKPGEYPISGEYKVKDIIDLAGGLSPKADKDHIELVFNGKNRAISHTTVALKEKSDFTLTSGDGLRVQFKPDNIDRLAVRITGEVARPGYYDLNKGETLYNLIERAGGITEFAYPEGAIFMRQSEKRRKQKIFQQTAQQLEQSIANYIMSRTEDEEPSEELQFAQRLAQELKTTPVVGRIVVEADPEILKRKTKKTTPTLLQAGDHLHIPRRTNTVTVTGEVLAPATLSFDMKKDGRDYIRAAGGTTRFADKSRAFIVFPDGSASPLKVASWNHSPDYDIPPGSTIIVPRDPKPYKFFNITSGITSIFSQLAITSVAVAELTDD